MTDFTPDRRSLLKGGATMLAAAATMSSEQLLGFAKAWAQTAQWKPEAGAKINLLRWKRFVEAEDVAFMKIVDAFQKATGVTINVSNESYDDIQPKASVAANTGQGLDMVWGLYSAAVPVPEQMHRHDRRRRLPRQEVRRLGSIGRGLRQAGRASGSVFPLLPPAAL